MKKLKLLKTTHEEGLYTTQNKNSTMYSLHPKLLETFNKSDLILSYSNLDIFWKSNHTDEKKHYR
jgi:hypothetical protein